MSHHHHTTLSTEGQDRRRLAMQRALAQVRLEGLEPDPAVFAYVERYIRGEITVEDAVAAMIHIASSRGK
ncbi:MAG TPA: antitoxin VbhA family protein [Ktedonobacterales bacterium]|nr:antitoxin VbhA family protein [Ktedonobacterales bacterium]